MQSERRRVSHKKSRRGCLNCKERRVKCDEGLPSCQRCCQSGGTCRYGSDPIKPRFRGFKIVDPSNLQVAKLEDAAEVADFEYFHFNTVPIFTTCQPSVLWSHTLGYVAQTSSMFKRIGIALGHQQRLTVERVLESRASDAEIRQANILYGKAIRSLRQFAATMSAEDAPILAFASSLLIALESLRGSSKDMLLHLHSGVRIATDASKDGRIRFTREMQAAVTMLQQYCVSSWMFCTTPGYKGDLTLLLQRIDFSELSNLYSSVQGTPTLQLHSTIGQVIFEVRKLMHPHTKPEDQPGILAELQRLRGKVSEIEQALPSPEESDEGPAVVAGNALLKAKAIMLELFLVSALTQKKDIGGETQKFKIVLALIESALFNFNSVETVRHDRDYVRPFSIGLGAVQMLEAVSSASPVEEIKAMAEALKRLCPTREGLWNAGNARLSYVDGENVSPKLFYAVDHNDRLATLEDVIPEIQHMLENLQVEDVEVPSMRQKLFQQRQQQ